MSPPLIQSPFPIRNTSSIQIPSPFIPSTPNAMNRPDDVSPNFQFGAAPRLSAGLSRPRMTKTRKSQHNRGMPGPEHSTFNRFRGVVDLDYSGESVVDMDNDGGGSYTMSSGSGVDGESNLESSILDEIRGLRLRDMDVSSSSGGAGVADQMRRLNMEDSNASGNRHFEFGAADDVTNRMRNLEVKVDDSDEAKAERRLYDEKSTSGGDPQSMVLDELGKLKLGSDNAAAVQPEGVEIKAPGHGTETKPEFVFSSKVDRPGTYFGEYNPRSPKGGLFSGFNQRVEFSSRREPVKNNLGRKMKVKLKESALNQPWGGVNFPYKESSFHYKPEPAESYSPMDVSPTRETMQDNRSVGASSLTSEESVHLDENLVANDYQSSYGDMVDEELVSATERLDILEGKDTKFGEGADQVSLSSVNEGVGTAASSEEPISAVASESFKSANEFSDFSEQNEDVSSTLNDEVQSRDETTEFFSASSSEIRGGVPFMFSAPSSSNDHVAPAMRNQKKKNRIKVSPDPYNVLKDTLFSDASSTIHFASTSRGPSTFNTKNEDFSAYHRKEGPGLVLEKEQPAKQETPCPSTTTTTFAAREASAKDACEKWRLRGNQAYSSGDLKQAEDCYAQGVNCITKSEASREGLRALMLCYSNRAAIRMALGRFRDALADCRAAAEIDPDFLKVQVRTANCYLALGEVAETSGLLMKLLKPGTEACADRKLTVEASESIQKAQRVSWCIDNSAELLRHKTSKNAEDSLQFIDEGLAISPYSEKLLQMKAEALFMLQRYQEVIHFCEQTLQSAEKNSPLLLSSNSQSSNLEPSEVLNKYTFRIWRYSFIFNSYYSLGKLEEGLGFLEKQTDLKSVTDRCGIQAVESLIPLLIPARELVKHKSAGNAAHLAGKHAEAIEHYTAALACSAESRPFAAICFGNRAAAYQALGQIPDAIADCNLAIALDKKYLKAISRRATLFEMIRDYEEAASDLQRLVSLLAKQLEEKANQSGATDRSVNSQSDLRQAHMRLAHVQDQAMKEPVLDFYLILGVEPSATSAELRKAYRKAALRHHPDKACQLLTRGENVDDGLWKEMTEEVQKKADRLFKMIGEAYSVLSDPTKRLRYEEEALKKAGGMCTSRMRTDGQSYGYQRNYSGRTAWKPPGSPSNQWFEPSRPSRFH